MCVLALAWRADPRWPLIAIANRDEFHARATAPLAQWHHGETAILAGRDLRSGGTWLGVSPQGRFAAVTNVRGQGVADPEKASRGALVSDMIARSGTYADPAQVPPDHFNPFNLLVATPDALHFLSNRPQLVSASLKPGTYGLSNGTLDEPWPKTVHLKSALNAWLAGPASDPEQLFDALLVEELDGPSLMAAQDLPPDAPTTPPFIRNPDYGTRCSTIVAIDAQGTGTIIERRFDAAAQETGVTRLAFGARAP